MSVAPASPDALGNALVEYVTAIVSETDAYENRKQEFLARLEAEGHRIISGGQTQEGWEITDWRTGETLASGTGHTDQHNAAVKRLDPDGRWWHVDNATHNLDYRGGEIRPPAALPATLAEAILDWAENNEDEARHLLSLSTSLTTSSENVPSN